jgi:hypothetical protein
MTSAINHRYPAIQGEFEDELEDELEFEDEAEDELPPRGGQGEFEFELEFEDELEDEAEDEVEFDFEAEAEAARQGELEDEAEDEAEAFVNPVRRIYPDAELMAHLSAQAARAESESEAEAFIGAAVPLVARLVPRAGRLIARNAPSLIRGATRITRRLRRTPAGRRFVAAVPVIVQRTVQSLADQAAAGRPVDGDLVLRTMATMAGRVLQAPQNRNSAMRAVRTFDRRYHQRWRLGGTAAAPRRRTSPAGSLSRGSVRRGRRRR